MDNRRWIRLDRFMRASHLYTGLFLVPWMMVYAISAFCLNHEPWFVALELKPDWKLVREVDLPSEEGSSQVPEELAKRILKHVELEGAHRIVGDPASGQMVIYRLCSAGLYQIVWTRQNSHVVVKQQQPFSFYLLFNTLHFQHGYDQPYYAYLAWAVIVDAVTISTVIWIISGIYIWARRPRRRLLGAICLMAGTLVFAWLAVLLCR